MDINLNEWLAVLNSFGQREMAEIGFVSFFILMLISLGTSYVISFLYLIFFDRRATGSMVHRAFPLLGIAVTAIFIGIQYSLPLSLGLLGALSIVRFRTPIKEPEEIGFIMLVIAASICCATFNLLFLIVLLSVAVLGLLIWKLYRGLQSGRMGGGMLIVTFPADHYAKAAEGVLEFFTEKFPEGKIDSLTENGDDSTLSYSFGSLKQARLLEVLSETRETYQMARTNVFFNHGRDL